MSTKRRSEYSAADWARLHPEQRYAIEQHEADIALGRTSNVIQTRAPDGRGVVFVDRASGAPIPDAPARHIGGLT